jgi:hypothetical protein
MSFSDFTRNPTKTLRKLSPAQYGLVAVIAAVVLGMVVEAMKGPEPPTDPEALALIEPLTTSFELLAFGPADAPVSERLHKWRGRVRIALDDGTATLGTEVQSLADELGDLSGLEITLVAPGERATLIVTRADGATGGCALELEPPEGGVIERVVLTLGTALAPEGQRACLAGGLARALGLPGNADLLTPSVFASNGGAAEFSATDRLVIEALYNARLRPGMSRKTVMGEMRDVFINLLRN